MDEREYSQIDALPQDVREALRAVCNEEFQRAAMYYHLENWGTTGIDLSKPGEIAKVTLAIEHIGRRRQS